MSRGTRVQSTYNAISEQSERSLPLTGRPPHAYLSLVPAEILDVNKSL